MVDSKINTGREFKITLRYNFNLFYNRYISNEFTSPHMFSRLLLVKSFIVISFTSVFAQGQMVFKEESFDFGNVTEGTQAVHEFEFVNKGNEPIIISNVQASCGCTTPFWTKEPVGPGNKGVIKASYNSSGRPGAFTKTITITSNASNTSKFLTIKGNVTPKPLISPSAKAELGAFIFDMGNVVKGKKAEKAITITNSGDAPLAILNAESGCKCIVMDKVTTVIKPGEKADIKLTYTPRQEGIFSEPVTLTTNDKNNPETKIYLKAKVEEDASLNSVVKESRPSVPFN
jgi:hypothetical protein